MADLLDQLEDPSQPQALPVDEIWALDAVNQGDSGVLNEAVLGNSCTSRLLLARRSLTRSPNSQLGGSRSRYPQLCHLLPRQTLLSRALHHRAP